jgi:hypothetical protein
MAGFALTLEGSSRMGGVVIPLSCYLVSFLGGEFSVVAAYWGLFRGSGHSSLSVQAYRDLSRGPQVPEVIGRVRSSLSFFRLRPRVMSPLQGILLWLRHTGLECHPEEIRTVARTKFIQQIGDMELDGTLGDSQLSSDLLIGKIFKE